MKLKKLATSFSVLAALSLALSGCGGSLDDAAQPQTQVTTVIVKQAEPTDSIAPAEATEAPTQDSQENNSPAQTEVQTPAQAAAPVGTSCGLSDTKASTLVVAENAAGLSCAQVQSIFAEFNKVFDQTTADFQVQGLTCHTRDEAARRDEGRSVTCSGNGTRLEAMLNYAGGVPVADTSAYYRAQNSSLEDSAYYFDTPVASCALNTKDVPNSEGIAICMHKGNRPHNGMALFFDLDLNTVPAERDSNSFSGMPKKLTNPDLTKLAAGSSITTGGVSCYFDGSQLTCSNANHSMTMSMSDFSSQ